MQLVVRHGAAEYEIGCELEQADGTVGDLARTWGLEGSTRITVDGRTVGRTTPLAEAGLGEGSIVGFDEPPGVAGPQPGRQAPTGVFNRPPRAVLGSSERSVVAPRPPQQPTGAARFGWAALIVPVVLGLAMAVLIQPRMALFALFSPAMLAANWLEDRRRAGRERREIERSHGAALDRFEAEVRTAYVGDLRSAWGAAVVPQELLRRADGRDSRLWERRVEHADFMRLPIGTGCVPWQPNLEGQIGEAAREILQRFDKLHDVPLQTCLGAGNTTGIAGTRGEVLGLARQLMLQAAVGHGPADLAIAVLTENPAEWDWAKWLPHVRIEGGAGRRLAATDDEIVAIAGYLPSEQEVAPLHNLVVVDLPDLAAGGRAAIRAALRAGSKCGVSGLALASRAVDLPSLATTVVVFDATGCRVRFADGEQARVGPWQVGVAQARATARALARIEDPELPTSAGHLPSIAHLPSLLGLDSDLEESIRARWERPRAHPVTVVGVSADGPLTIDLAADGPHALLGGTTGAGKSELLRTLVAGLAAECSPAAINFVLIDYKGGSAFDVCAGLPHTVGVITDLDDRLAERALICLEAELRYREGRLREAAVSDISELSGNREPLPRLLVVVDEFAALAKELPDFIEALVGVAQRGRSLGVHLLLATQRPSGVISESIKANTNLRIALRMQDGSDSADVIGSGAATQIARTQPGRGWARRGPQDVVAFQTAIVTDRSLCTDTGRWPTVPFVFAHQQPRPAPSPSGPDGPTDLERIVCAAQRVAQSMSLPPARSPWPDPLPSRVTPFEVPAPNGEPTVFALADEPHKQRQIGVGWSPAAGNLLLYGLPGSGTTTALASLITGLARDHAPDQLHIYVLDFDDQLLGPLIRLPHVGAVIGVQDRERQLRLLRRLSEELGRRRNAAVDDLMFDGGDPLIILVLDNFGGFSAAHDAPGDMLARNLVARIVSDGPGVGINAIFTAKHPGDVPTHIASLIASKTAFRLADRYDYSGLGIPAVDPPTTPGRAFESGSGREIQIVLPHRKGIQGALAENRWDQPRVAPWQIDVLPQEVSLGDFAGSCRIGEDEWYLPLGIGDTTLLPSGWRLRDGEHALVTGPAGAGKSTALATIATMAKAASPDLAVAALTPRGSLLEKLAAVDRIVTVDSLDNLDHAGAQLVLVDDAELVAASPQLSRLVNGRRRGLRVVAAGSADAIRSMYGHWTQDLRRSRIGCALRPNLVSDGDLWQTPLPRRGPEHFPVGRGYLLAGGRAELVQLGRM